MIEAIAICNGQMKQRLSSIETLACCTNSTNSKLRLLTRDIGDLLSRQKEVGVLEVTLRGSAARNTPVSTIHYFTSVFNLVGVISNLDNIPTSV